MVDVFEETYPLVNKKKNHSAAVSSRYVYAATASPRNDTNTASLIMEQQQQQQQELGTCRITGNIHHHHQQQQQQQQQQRQSPPPPPPRNKQRPRMICRPNHHHHHDDRDYNGNRPTANTKEAIIYLGGIDHGKQQTRFISSRLAVKLNHHRQQQHHHQQQQADTNNHRGLFVYKTRGRFGYGPKLPRDDSNEQYSDLYEFETERHTIYLVEKDDDETTNANKGAAAAAATSLLQNDTTPVVVNHSWNDDTDDNGNNNEWPIVDIFQLDYLESMSRSWRENRSLLVQTMAMTVAMFCYLTCSVSAIVRILWNKLLCCCCCFFCCCRQNCHIAGGSSSRHPAAAAAAARVRLCHVVQFSTIVFLFVLLLAYFCILLVAVGQTLLGLMMTMMGQHHGDSGITAAQQITILTTFVGFIAPQVWHRAMVDAIVDYTAVVYYLVGIGPLRTKLIDQLDALIEQVHEQWNYDRIHVVAYSFGALLAIDALFPANKTEIPPEYKLVDHFVTFGCPLDMVHALLPHYYCSTNRYFSSSDKDNMRWTNFFIPGDALGSNFGNNRAGDRNPDDDDDDDAGVDAMRELLPRLPDKNIVLQPVTADGTNLLLDLISFCLVNGIRLHVKHWSDQSDTRDISNELVKIIFEDHWILTEQVDP